ncbi:MAG: hypothetical protein U0Q03_20890 [Acidimicrobiales bacterium]
MSLSELTTASAWIAGLAIVALIAAGWRKPARATVDPTREGRRSRAARERAALELEETSTDLAGGASPWRKVWAVVASSGLALVTGAIIATVVSFGIAFTVIRLTDMLKR